MVHPCGVVRAKTSALRSVLTHPAYEKGHTIYYFTLFELLFAVENVFVSLRDLIFLSND